MASSNHPDRNLALELTRVTEAAAMAAARWVGRGDKNGADGAAVNAMRMLINSVSMRGVVVIGEGEKDEAPMLYNGEHIGDGSPPEFFFLSDVLETDCTPWENCPRLFLRRALERLERTAGLRLLAALEHEFVYSGAERNLASAFNVGSVRRAGEFGPA